jgi:hypothetical protein
MINEFTDADHRIVLELVELELKRKKTKYEINECIGIAYVFFDRRMLVHKMLL